MRALTLVASSFFITSVLFAQTDRGSISGTVADPSGAVVSAAKVEARNIDNGAVYDVGASATGNYELPQLPTGNYELVVTSPGFKRYLKQNIFLPVAQKVRVDVVLDVGANTDTITVVESTPLLKTESGEVSHNITSEALDTLPVLNVSAQIRSPYAASVLLPGMEWTQTSSFQNIRVNGIPSNTQSLRVEGQESSNATMMAFGSQNQPSVDSIQEFSVQTSNYAAEFGQAGGAVFIATMKSGTNAFHGTGYDYFVNEALNASTAFTNAKPAPSLSPGPGTTLSPTRPAFSCVVGLKSWPRMAPLGEVTVWMFT